MLTDVTYSIDQLNNCQLDSKRGHHNPYFDVRPPESSSTPVTPLMSAASDSPTYATSPASPTYSTATALPYAPPPMHSAPASPPARFMTKRYVDGRPVVHYHDSCPVEWAPAASSVVLIERRRHRYRCGESPLPPRRYVVPPEMADLCLLARYVVVEGDRSHDVGRVVGTERIFTEHTNGLLRMLRIASDVERTDFVDALPNDDDAALRTAQRLARKLPTFHVVDATFQADRKKLTLWYTADAHVNYRPLTRALHHKYRCRVWLEAVPHLKE